MTKRQLLRHFRRVLSAYVPGIANRTGIPACDFEMVWSTATPVAMAGGGIIYLNHGWFSKHPDDYGALVHEYTHLIQDVPGGTCPSEVIEGFADAMRYVFGLFDPGWWSPSPMAEQIAGLSYNAFRRLSRAMHTGEYDVALLT